MTLIIDPVANGWIVKPYQNISVGQMTDFKSIHVFTNFEEMMAHIKTEAPKLEAEAAK